MPRRAIFLLIVFALFGGTYAYLGQRLLLTTSLTGAGLASGALLLAAPFALILWLPLVRWQQDSPDSESPLTHTLEWIAYFSMGWISLLLLLTLIRDAIAVLLYFGGRNGADRGGILLFGQGPSGILLLAAFALLGMGFLRARRGPVVRKVTVELNHLPPELDGFRIAQISDLHLNPRLALRYVQNVVRETIALAPDVIALTGDIGDSEPAQATEQLKALTELRATHASFYVTGNHEYYWDAPAWIQAMTRTGAIPLMGQHQIIEHNGARIAFAGIADPAAVEHGGPAPEIAIAGVSPGIVKVLLAHRPSAIFAAEQAGFDLVLAGHTHAGQFLPWSLVVRWFHPVSRGLHRIGRTWIYVSAGTGFWGPPIRLGTTSEITLIELRR